MSQPQLEKDISALESQVKDLVAKGGILDASDQLLSAKDALYARAPADRTWWNNRIRVLHTAFKLLTQFKNSERPADKTLVYFAKLMEQINGSTQSSSSTAAQPNKPGASISTRPPAASAKVATAMVTTTTSKPNPAAPTAPAKSSVPTPAPSPAPPKLSVSETVNPSVPPKAPALPKTTSTTAPKKTSAAAPTKQGATATSRPSTTRPSNPSPGPSHPEADSPRDDRPMKKDPPKSKKPQKGKTAAEQHAVGEDDDDEYAPETIPKGKAKRRKGQPGPTKGSAPSPADENDDDDSIVVNPKKPKKGKGKAKAKQPQEEATDDEKAAPREYIVSGTYDPPCHHCVGGGIKCVYPPHRGSCIPCKVSKKKCEFALTKQEMGNIFRVPKTKKPKQPSTAPLQNDNYVEISDDESSEAPASPPAAPTVSKTPATSSIAAPQPAASSSARTSAPSSAPFTTLVEPSIQRITSMLERIEQGMTTRVDNIEASLLGMGTRLGRMERMLVHLDRNDSQLEFHGGAVDRLLYAFCEWQGMPGVGRNPRPGQPSAPSGSQPSPPIAQAGPSNSATSATSHPSAQVGSSAVGQGQSAWPVQAQQQHLGPRDAPTKSAHTPTTVVPASATPMMPARLPPQDASHSVGGHALKSPPPVDMASPPAAPFPSANGPASPSASEVLAVPIGVPGAASDGDQEMGVARNTSVASGADDETAATLTAPLPEVPASSDGPANEDIPDVTLEPATPSTSQAGTSAQEELLAPPAPRRSPRIRSPTPMPSGSGKRKSSNASSSESKRQKL